ncbi:hypothetical protein SAMN04488032_105105 [Pacificibacter marinus]|uniref:Uncharacterized protein n=2 Tax=Pacificibacter marinus TaxID=658057 RepID=A0A1Y5SVB2_9RHOB|nr:hypothetical protein SAMN04488032_105105 [Pacificibacter marinus]SLN45864.1 hypothetical protein PAM7971_02220 [Pacificibacter marinus]
MLAPVLLAATSATAAEPLSGAQFDAYATGKTLTYAENGEAYGAEQYLPNNRVRWAFDEETCLEGVWYEKDDNICFVYEDGAAPQCWNFFLEHNKLRAIFNGDNGTELYEAWATDGPLACMAPGLGV